MKFDFAIGNPPYQEEQNEANSDSSKNYATPVYNLFLDAAYGVANKVEMIHPARFLFNAGSTPKAWNEKMLNDEHFKVLMYEPDASKVFSNTDIKGGVSISYYDATSTYKPITIFTQYEELNDIKDKVINRANKYVEDIAVNRGSYRYSDKAYSEEPEEMKKTADRRIAPSAFERMPRLFTKNKPQDGREYIKIFGNNDHNDREYRYFRKDFLADVDSLSKYKVIVSKANGNGQFGETLSSPVIIGPDIGFTETYIAVGVVESDAEAMALRRYISTKFARAMLGLLKVTQNMSRDTWKYVPLQDFTDKSDIDWSVSIANIDKQLYKKYGLSEDEINFIETHVKEME